MNLPDTAKLAEHAELVIRTIGRESVEVYLFLCDEFAKGYATQNSLFQFVYRSFYRLDSAGLLPEFKARYFELMEVNRGVSHVDIAAIARDLHRIPNRKGQPNLQFSFVTKLANTVNPKYPIYDTEIAKVFDFQAPYTYIPFDTRLEKYLTFHLTVHRYYDDIIARGTLDNLIRLFKDTYSPIGERVPPIKIIDFIFWAAGKHSGNGETPGDARAGVHVI